MKAVISSLGTIVIVLLLLALLLVVTLIAGAGIVLVGRVLMLVGDLSTFQASLIALGVATLVIGSLIIATNAEKPRVPEWWEPDYAEDDDDEDEDEFPAPRSRNDPCPCGSGKKYKHCHGQVD